MTAPTWEILILGLCLYLSLLSLGDRSYATEVIRITDPDLLACWDNPFQVIAKLRLLKYPLGFKRYLKHLLGLRLGSKACSLDCHFNWFSLQLVASSALWEGLLGRVEDTALMEPLNNPRHTQETLWTVLCLCISWTQRFLLACLLNQRPLFSLPCEIIFAAWMFFLCLLLFNFPPEGRQN